MPFQLTPAEPFLTTSALPVPSVYVIIDDVKYERRGLAPKRIAAKIGYYASENASLTADSLALNGLPGNIVQEVSPEEANGLPIFTVLETLLRQQLEAVLPANTLIEAVR